VIVGPSAVARELAGTGVDGNQQTMSLNKFGNTIELLDTAGNVVDRTVYPASATAKCFSAKTLSNEFHQA
jgi:hypothetical protein